MQYRPLGKTSMQVSLIGLGTMTWGEQNTEAEAHQQLDAALEAGVNFIDAAELYPIPARRETYGLTERYIGTWLQARRNREQVILATKVAGPAARLAWIREGKQRLDAANIHQALENSLQRLQTDYIDLYQVHWPDRHTNFFGQLGYTHKPAEALTPVEETLDVLNGLVQSGKVRAVGISNETPWGMMRYLFNAEGGKVRVASIQNPYSLLNRTFEIGLAEIAMREQCGLLAYSPLAFGVLSGKYLQGEAPPKSRIALFGDYFDRYASPQALAATRRYVALAQEVGLSPAQMALAFVNQQPFVTSNIIGATTLEQLRENIESVNITLSPDILTAIDAIHREYPNPSP